MKPELDIMDYCDIFDKTLETPVKSIEINTVSSALCSMGLESEIDDIAHIITVLLHSKVILSNKEEV
jgi:hypothetical protein